MAGRVDQARELTNGTQTNGAFRVRRSRVVLTPRSRRQVCGGVRAQPGFAAPYSQATVTRKPDRRGEHEGNRKTIARGMPGDFRCDRGDYARARFFLACEAAGASSARHSLRPHIFRGKRFMHNSGASRRGIADTHGLGCLKNWIKENCTLAQPKVVLC
jgi:hypothetical protein